MEQLDDLDVKFKWALVLEAFGALAGWLWVAAFKSVSHILNCSCHLRKRQILVTDLEQFVKKFIKIKLLFFLPALGKKTTILSLLGVLSVRESNR